MVKNNTKGVSDWLLQRLSAIGMAVYVLFLFYFITQHPLTYTTWHELFAKLPMKIASSLVCVLTLAHAWIGLWIVGTDYLPAKARLVGYALLLLSLLALLAWGLSIIWGVSA